MAAADNSLDLKNGFALKILNLWFGRRLLAQIPMLFAFGFAFLALTHQFALALSPSSIEFSFEESIVRLPETLQTKLSKEPPSSWSEVIIKELVSNYKYRDVEVFADPATGHLVRVNAKKLKRVIDVTLNGLSSGEEIQFKRLLKSRVGFGFFPDDLVEDKSRILRRLAERGYLKADVSEPLVETSAVGDVRLTFSVDRGRSCTVAEVLVEPEQSFFDFLTSPIEAGVFCDVISIQDSLEKDKGRLRGLGYLDAKLSLLEMKVTPDKERAVVKLNIDRGVRTRVEVINLATGAVSGEVIKGKSGLTPAELVFLSKDDLKEELAQDFRNKGFANVILNGPNEYKAQNGDSVFRYFAQPGNQIFIGSVEIRGAVPFTEKELMEKLNLEPGFFSGRVAFVQDKMAEIREKFLSLLFEEGYAEAQIEGPLVSIDGTGRLAKLTFRVEIGPKYLVRDISILGKPEDFKSDQAVFGRVVAPGTPVSKSRLRLLDEETQIELLQLGYAYAEVKSEPNLYSEVEKIKPVQIILAINSGPRVRVGTVFAEGELYGKGDRVILESGLKTGDYFTPEALETARLRILKHDLFGNVQVEALNSEDLQQKKETVDVVIRAQGRGGYALGLGPGYGTRNGYRFSVDYAKNNLTRDGLRFNSTASLSQEKQQRSFNDSRQILGRKISLGFVEPLFRLGEYVSPFDVSVLSGLEVSAQPISNRFYETIETRASYKPYFFGLSWNLYAKLGHEWSRVIGSGVEPIEALDRPSLRIHEVEYGASLDTRNSVEWPTGGFLTEASASHARFGLWSEVQYDRFSFDFSKYFPIFGRFSGAIGGGFMRIGNVVNEKSETVTAPGSRRSSLAGRSVVRGFPDGGTGLGPLIWLDLRAPESNPDLDCSPVLRSIGASNLLYLKGETRYRSKWLSEMLGFAWFVDSGAAYFTRAEKESVDQRLAEFNARARNAGGKGADADICYIRSAKLVGNDDISYQKLKTFQDYIRRSYISTGLGVRVIIPNLASINIDWGIPIYEPSESSGQCSSVEKASQSNAEAPKYLSRRADDRIFGVLTTPGAFYIGIGASF